VPSGDCKRLPFSLQAVSQRRSLRRSTGVSFAKSLSPNAPCAASACGRRVGSGLCFTILPLSGMGNKKESLGTRREFLCTEVNGVLCASREETGLPGGQGRHTVENSGWGNFPTFSSSHCSLKELDLGGEREGSNRGLDKESWLSVSLPLGPVVRCCPLSSASAPRKVLGRTDRIRLSRRKDHFIFTVESTGHVGAPKPPRMVQGRRSKQPNKSSRGTT